DVVTLDDPPEGGLGQVARLAVGFEGRQLPGPLEGGQRHFLGRLVRPPGGSGQKQDRENQATDRESHRRSPQFHYPSAFGPIKMGSPITLNPPSALYLSGTYWLMSQISGTLAQGILAGARSIDTSPERERRDPVARAP